MTCCSCSFIILHCRIPLESSDDDTVFHYRRSSPPVPYPMCYRYDVDEISQMWSICFSHVMIRLSKCLYPYWQKKDSMCFKCQKWILYVSLVSLFSMIQLLYRGSIWCFGFVAVFFVVLGFVFCACGFFLVLQI